MGCPKNWRHYLATSRDREDLAVMLAWDLFVSGHGDFSNCREKAGEFLDGMEKAAKISLSVSNVRDGDYADMGNNLMWFRVPVSMIEELELRRAYLLNKE